jgi:hypothetical protein
MRLVHALKVENGTLFEPGSVEAELSHLFRGKVELNPGKINIFEAVRYMDAPNAEAIFKDKSGLFSVLYNRMLNDRDNAGFYLKIFLGLEELPVLDWGFLVDFIKEGRLLGEVSDFVSKHIGRQGGMDALVGELRHHEDYFYKKKELVNILTTEEKYKISLNCQNVDFYENLDGINLFSNLKNQSDGDSLLEFRKYGKNHFKILEEFVRMSEVVVEAKQNRLYYRDIMFCLVVRLRNDPKYIDEFIANLKTIDENVTIDIPFLDFPFNWTCSRKDTILNRLSEGYMTGKSRSIRCLILTILGYCSFHGYFIPVYLRDLKHATGLWQLEFLSEYLLIK